jgi:hypothetical protein
LGTIPKFIQPHIASAYPDNVCLVGSVQPSGYAQITPRGSVMVFDDDNMAIWERGKGSTTANIQSGTKLMIYYRNRALRESGVLPAGGIARFYGVASVHKSGATYDKVWEKLIEPEKKGDPEKKGFAVLIKIERSEDLLGKPLPEK